MIKRLSQHEMLKVSYITKAGAIQIRAINNEVSTLWDLAKATEAQYLVAAFDWDAAASCPIWSVYDVRKAHNRAPDRSMSLPLPVKQFTTETREPAEVYALMLVGGSHG